MNTWIFYALLSAIFAALVAIFGKIGVSKSIDNTVATTIRSVVMTIFLLLATLFMRKFSLLGTINNRTLVFIILSGVAGAMSWLFYFLALKFGPVTGVSALDRLSVVFVVLIAALFLQEKITFYTGMGALLITMGAILMTFK